MPARPVGGSDILTNYSPASETLTGATYNGDPVYRTHYSSATATNGATVVAASCKKIVAAGGEVTTSFDGHINGFPIGGTSAANIYREDDAGATQYYIKLVVTGTYVNQPIEFWVDYTKN